MRADKCKRVTALLGQCCSPLRLGILCILSAGDRTIKELAELSGAKVNNVSQHLKMMELGGLISKQRRGQFVVCSLKDERISKLIGCLEKYF